MKGKCETCQFDKMCERGEVTLSAFDIKFNVDRTKITSCKKYKTGEPYP